MSKCSSSPSAIEQKRSPSLGRKLGPVAAMEIGMARKRRMSATFRGVRTLIRNQQLCHHNNGDSPADAFYSHISLIGHVESGASIVRHRIRSAVGFSFCIRAA
jgi:hypothetical protein